MKLAGGLILGMTLLITACDNLNLKVVTDSDIEKQIDLLTQHGPWLCEGIVGEGDEKMQFNSAQIWTKAGVDVAASYMQASFQNKMFIMRTSEMGLMKIERANQINQYPQVFELKGIDFTDEVKARLPFISREDQKIVEELLATRRSNFDEDSRAEFENPTSWELSNLSETSLTFSNEQATINCQHGEVSTLFNQTGLVAK